MAEELGGFVELVGGPSQAAILMGPLGSLATVEETVVRDKVRAATDCTPQTNALRPSLAHCPRARTAAAASHPSPAPPAPPPRARTSTAAQAVESACLVIQGLDNASVVEHVLPVIQKLTQDDWFTARVSACGLFAAAYSRLTDEPSKTTLRTCVASQQAAAAARARAQRVPLRSLTPPPSSFRHFFLSFCPRRYFQTLCADETPMVKRAASKAIGGFARAASGERDVVLSELLPLFLALAADDQDSVRLLAIENCTAFAGILGEAENNKSILPLVKSCALDKSWRVRNSVAREFAALARAMGLVASCAELLPLYTKLLVDPEAEVRASVARNLAPFAEIVGADRFLSSIAPQLRELAADPAQNVRCAAVEGLMDTVAALPRDAATAHIVPLVMQALRDEAPEVRLKVLDNLAKIVDTVGAPFLESAVLPALLVLGNDALWRVREKVIEQIPLFAGQLVRYTHPRARRARAAQRGSTFFLSPRRCARHPPPLTSPSPPSPACSPGARRL